MQSVIVSARAQGYHRQQALQCSNMYTPMQLKFHAILNSMHAHSKYCLSVSSTRCLFHESVAVSLYWMGVWSEQADSVPLLNDAAQCSVLSVSVNYEDL